MTKRKIYFRADASATIGYGHFVRTLALADMLKDDFECVFFTSNPTAYQVAEMEKVCPFVALDWETRFETFLTMLEGDEIVVLDNYFFTSKYQKLIKDKGCKLVCVDDMHDKHYYADTVINHALSNESLFDIEPYTRLCLGLKWALRRKPFLKEKKVKKDPNHWFVSFGGSDFNNLTGKFLSYLERDERVKSVTTVIGDAYRNKDALSKYTKTTVLKNLTAMQMAEEMAKSEYAVLPCSGVSIEALSCGCKVSAGFFVENQIGCYNEWVKRDYIVGMGNLTLYQSDDFINILSDKEDVPIIDFHDIPTRYIDLFKSLA